MKVVWAEDAKRDLREALRYVARENPVASRRIARRIRDAVRKLDEFPQGWRRGAIKGTRELAISGLPYIVVYRVDENDILVLALFHTSTDKPRGG